MTNHSNSLPDTDSVLSAKLIQPDGTQLSVNATYDELGQYFITLNATRSGNATILVYLDGLPVGHSPTGPGSYTLTVVPSNPFALNSYPFGFTSGVDTVQVAGVPGTFYVQLQDVFGNNITTDVGDVATALVMPTFDSDYMLSINATFDPALSYYIGTYNITLEGNFTIAVEVGQTATKDSKRELQVVPAPVYGSTSVLYDVPPTATAGVLQIAQLQLKDMFGNNASNAAANFTVHLFQGTTEVNGTVTNCIRGLCQVTYLPTFLEQQRNLLLDADTT